MAKRKSSSSAGSPNMAPPEDLPPKREGKATKRTSAPLYKTSFNNFIYSLVAILVCIGAFYTWRIWAWKRDVGGWWNLMAGKKPHIPSTSGDGSGTGNVDAKISELASALGIPPATLATAIASAVSEHVPPATLSSIAKNEASTASVVQSMVQDPNAEATEAANSFGSKMGNIVGMDEPDMGLD